MFKQLLKVKEFSRINSYGTSFLVAKLEKFSLGCVPAESKSISTLPVTSANAVPDILKISALAVGPIQPLNRYPLREIKDVPRIPINIIEPPRQRMLTEINSIVNEGKEIKLPEAGVNIEKHAVRLIVIRRKKMKKHKLKKLRRKMKYEWAKVKQRREMRKEKAFRAEIFAQIKEAENFSAEKYVEEKIRKATEVPIPRFIKNRRLPQFVIKQMLGIK